MTFTIPDSDVAGVPARQSPWYSTDIAILVAGFLGAGVLTGCEVTAQGLPNMTLAVASGTIQPAAGVAAVTVTAGNVTIATAHATLPRIDLVTAAADGTKTVTAGTAAAEPKPPALPSGHIALAMVDVPATDVAIQAAQITSKRVVVAAASGTPAVSVTDETTWGIVPDVGTGTDYARGDHTHGSPALPTGGGTGGRLLIADVHSTPLDFGDILQVDAGDAFLYAD